MDNVFNFYNFCNSLDQDPDGIYLSKMTDNLVIIRDDLLPFSTRGRYAKNVIEHLHKITNSTKFIYKTRWYDSTQIAISQACNELNFELLILTLATNRDTNSFSEIAKMFGTKYEYYSDYESLKLDYDLYLKNYTEIPVELEHSISKDILIQMIEKIESEIDYDDIWIAVENSSFVASAFSNRSKNIYLVSVTDNIPEINFECTKIISKFNYSQSCEPYYPPYATNSFVDGKLWIELQNHLKKHKDRKVLVFNKY